MRYISYNNDTDLAEERRLPCPTNLMMRGNFLLVICLLIAGCASVKIEKVFDAKGGERITHWPMWPSAPADPRFAYAGQLVGEENFQSVERDTGASLARTVAWLVGLGQQRMEPNLLQRPQGGATDDEGRVYVSDVSRNAVLVFDKPAGELRVWSRATHEQNFVAPIGIAMGADDTVLVADAELGLVARLAKDGSPLKPFGMGILQRPTGIVRDRGRGWIFVADTKADNLKVFNDGGELLETIGQSGEGEVALNAPTYLAHRGDEIYVTDTLNARIQVLSVEGDFLRFIGRRGLYVGNLTRPKGVAVDSRGHVYVTESYYDYLLVYDRSGEFLLPIGGAGSDPGQFFLPAGVWMDEKDMVYIADMFNGRVQMLQFLGGE